MVAILSWKENKGEKFKFCKFESAVDWINEVKYSTIFLTFSYENKKFGKYSTIESWKFARNIRQSQVDSTIEFVAPNQVWTLSQAFSSDNKAFSSDNNPIRPWTSSRLVMESKFANINSVTRVILNLGQELLLPAWTIPPPIVTWWLLLNLQIKTYYCHQNQNSN